MDFFGLFKKKASGSKDVAKDRLKLILLHDRGDVSPELLENIKNEIMQVLRKYVEFDEDLELQITHTDSDHGSIPALIANIPIKKMKASSE
jgi:cell division topological specificity factor